MIDADTVTGLSPETDGVHGALDPYFVVVPYSNIHSLTSMPRGVTVPLRVAEVAATDDAASVTTVGGPGLVW